MDKINEQLYQANIELVDRNRLLEEDVKKAQKQIVKLKEIIKKLKGESYGNNWKDSWN